MMEDQERWWQSRAIWGGIIALLAFGATFFGLTVSVEEQATLVDLVIQVATPAGALVAFILTLVGRIGATKKITRKAK